MVGDEEGEGLAKCGLTDENAAWVKKASGEVWSDGRNCCLNQRTRHQSVV